MPSKKQSVVAVDSKMVELTSKNLESQHGKKMDPSSEDEDREDDSSINGSRSSTVWDAEQGGGSSETSNEVLAHKESRHVAYSKILVFVVIASAAAAVGATVYMFTSRANQSQFENEVSV